MSRVRDAIGLTLQAGDLVLTQTLRNDFKIRKVEGTAIDERGAYVLVPGALRSKSVLRLFSTENSPVRKGSTVLVSISPLSYFTVKEERGWPTQHEVKVVPERAGGYNWWIPAYNLFNFKAHLEYLEEHHPELLM